MCQEEKILMRHNKVVKQLFKKFKKKINKKKKTEAVTGKLEAGT